MSVYTALFVERFKNLPCLRKESSRVFRKNKFCLDRFFDKISFMEQKKELSPNAAKLFRLIKGITERISHPEVVYLFQGREDERSFEPGMLSHDEAFRVAIAAAMIMREMSKLENADLWRSKDNAKHELVFNGYVERPEVPSAEITRDEFARYGRAELAVDLSGLIETGQETVPTD